jgi:hypothetical protein
MDANIRVNNARECELEFEVNIQGISVDAPENAAQVRFVITSVHNGNLSFPCDRRADSTTKWFVKLPPLPVLSETANTHMFRIEVIIDGYYFEPASGNLIVLRDPEVSLSKVAKPTVTAKIESPDKDKAKPAEELKKEGPEDKKEEDEVEEDFSGGGVQIDQQPSPNLSLLVPEFPPENDAEGDEHAKGHVRWPDEGSEDSPVVEEPEEEDLAEQTIRETVGKPKKPTKPGFLFNRDKGGKTVVSGLEPDQKTKKRLAEKADAVKKALAKS